MKYIFSFLKPYKLMIVAAYSFTIVELMTELLLPFFLGKMINDGVVTKDISNIVMWGSIMISLAFLAFISGIFNSFFAAHTSSSFAYDIREKLFTKIQTFSFKNLSQHPTSSLMTRFTNDVRQIQGTVFMGLRIMAKAPMMVLGGVIMAFIVDAKLALIFLVTVPVLTAFLMWVLKRASRMFENVQRKVDSVNSVMQENLAGMRLIKAFFRRKHEEDRFVDANRDLAITTRSTFRFVEASMPILLLVMNLSLVFIIWFGNTYSLAGNTSVGNVVAIVNYALRVAMSISMFTFITLAFSRMQASSKRLKNVLTVKVDSTDKRQTASKPVIQEGSIQFENVFFHYPSTNQTILKDVSFEVRSHEKLAIIGATGSGKTSLFQLIPRLYEINSGTIKIDNKPISHYALDELRGNIGYVPQNPLLFTGSIFDNIIWGKEHAEYEEVIQSAKDAQIHETIMSLPDGYETRVGQKGVNLSGGQKQRISIARALIRKPKILMLDDSTSALDLATESRLLDVIQNDECTMLNITQKVSTALRADRILLMDYGKILAVGTHEELLNQSTLYKDIVESQFGKEDLYA